MSLDSPFYEELCRRKHPARWWWIVGDRLYYLGLLSAVIGFATIPSTWLISLIRSKNWDEGLGVIAVVLMGVFSFFLGTFMKGRAHRLGERDGITVDR